MDYATEQLSAELAPAPTLPDTTLDAFTVDEHRVLFADLKKRLERACAPNPRYQAGSRSSRTLTTRRASPRRGRDHEARSRVVHGSAPVGLRLGAGDRCGPAPVAPAASPAWRVQLATDAREGSLKVRIEMPHGDFGVWALTRPQGKVRAVAAHDASGVVEVERSGEASFTLRPARAVVPPLVLEYEVLPPEAQGGAFPMEVTPDRAAFSGASVLVTPTGHASERVDLRLTLLPSDDFHQRAASSLAPEAEVSTSVSFDELAAAAFVFGAVGVAKFSAPEGRDHAAWVGYFSFDPRWASAEAAGVRTMADRWLGITRPAGDPSVGLVFVATRGHTRELGITPALRGLPERAST